MSRAIYIVGIAFSFLFIFVVAYYDSEVSKAKVGYLWSNFDVYGGDLYSSGYEHKKLTVAAGMWSCLFFLMFIGIDIFGLVKINTKTTKVLGIVGLSVSGIFLLWNLGMISSPESITFDEVSPAWGGYGITILTFMVIGLIQAIRVHKGISNKPAALDDLLDS